LQFDIWNHEPFYLQADPRRKSGPTAGKDVSDFANHLGLWGHEGATRMTRLLEAAISQSHGILFVVASPHNVDRCFSAFNRFSRFDPPINLNGWERPADDDEEPPYGVTFKVSALLNGLCRTDGIVVFSEGYVCAYNAFVRMDAEAAAASVGGARSQARQAIRTLHRDLFQAMLFCSQDGVPEYERLKG
jgi:hypothetical protein